MLARLADLAATLEVLELVSLLAEAVATYGKLELVRLADLAETSEKLELV